MKPGVNGHQVDVGELRRRHFVPPPGEYGIAIVPASAKEFRTPKLHRVVVHVVVVDGEFAGCEMPLSFALDGDPSLRFIARDLATLEAWAKAAGVPFEGDPLVLLRSIWKATRDRPVRMGITHNRRKDGAVSLVATTVRADG